MKVQGELFLGALAACAMAAWIRSRGIGLRAGLARLGWGAGLVGLALALLLTPPLDMRYPGILAMPVLAAAAVAVWPGSAARLAMPPLLVLLGLYGIGAARDDTFQVGLQNGTFLTEYRGSAQLVLPLAYGLILLGLGLARFGMGRGSAWARLVLGRLAQDDRPGQRWAFLLAPVVLMAGALLWPMIWFGGGAIGAGWTAVALAGTFWLMTRRPQLAARAATVGLVAVGMIAAVVAVAPASVPQAEPGSVLDGLVVLTPGAGLAPVALLQGLALIALGLLIAPATFPQVRRVIGLPDGELARRVERLTESRAVAVDTAAADLRRLERDLHDGAQARLVALGMNLRAAERLIPTSPDAALALVAEARESSARALTELRELVRGVHPPVLADRGLADALRALALDTPMKVSMDIDLPERLPAPVETACYFAVAEVLTNAAKHSGARDGQLSAAHRDGVLRITVTDFGVGGADPARGTGLAGVERRLAAFDGIVAVSSPAGGPTMVVMEVPCASSSPKTSSC